MSIASSKVDVSAVISRTPWFTKGLQREHLDVPISHITFLAHPVPNSEGHLSNPTNHWTALLHLNHDNDISQTRSAVVHLEVSPTMGGGQPGTIIVKTILDHDVDAFCDGMSMNHRVSATVIVPPGQLKTTVSDILKVIIDLKRDYYVFSPVGEGCRFWLHTLVGDLTSGSAGQDHRIIISHEDAEKVRADLRLHWPSGSQSNGHPHPREISRGSFPKSAAT